MCTSSLTNCNSYKGGTPHLATNCNNKNVAEQYAGVQTHHISTVGKIPVVSEGVPDKFSIRLMLFKAKLRYSSFLRRATFSTQAATSHAWHNERAHHSNNDISPTS